MTGAGAVMRAVSDDREAAALLGVPTERVVIVAFLLAGALAGLAGLLIAPQSPIGLEDGVLLGLKGMAAALLGRLGSLRLAIAGGLAIGAAEGADPRRAQPRRAAGRTCSCSRCWPCWRRRARGGCWRDRRRPRPLPGGGRARAAAGRDAGRDAGAGPERVRRRRRRRRAPARAGRAADRRRGAAGDRARRGGGRAHRRARRAAPSRRSSRCRRGRWPGSRTSRCSGSRRCPAARRA